MEQKCHIGVENALSDDVVTRVAFGERGNSLMHLAKLWDGVYLWANQVTDRYLPYGVSLGRRFATINYCLGGRCEIAMPDDTFIYMEPGMLCLNEREPKEGYWYPSGSYTGVELAFDMSFMEKEPPAALRDYGDFGLWVNELLRVGRDSYIAGVTDEFESHMRELYSCLQKAEFAIGDYRFLTLRLLYELQCGGLTPLKKSAYVTKGQRRIVLEVEERITEDVSRRFTVKELAVGYGISPSALKKFVW